MGNHVFVCYARKDSEFALGLATNLKNRGVPVWVDQWNIEPSEDWDQAIDTAIRECAKFLIVLSPLAVASREVRGELRLALNENKPITPVIYRPCVIPRQLLTVQYVDFSSSGSADDELLQRVIRVLGRSQEQRPSTRPERGEVKEGTKSEEKSTVIVPPDPQAKSFTNSIGMELILIPAGEFLMGSNYVYNDEKPVRQVIISKPFYLGKYPVTQEQWQQVMGYDPSRFTDDLNRPFEYVSWDHAQEFLRRLNEREKDKPYRLPTEAEWEYAARAGAKTTYCFGDSKEPLREYAWYNENSGGRTHPVGQLKPNAWGLYDVHGNVWEWVQDWYAKDYYGQRPNPDRDPQGPDKGEYRTVRGGSWINEAEDVRVASRTGFEPGLWNDGVGFRCAQ